MTTTSVETLNKVLRFGSMRLPFPDNKMTVEEAMDLYRPNFPWLSTATVGEPVPEGGDLVYEIEKAPAKTKG